MVKDLANILQNVVNQKMDSAVLIHLFKEGQLSKDQETQVHLYLKKIHSPHALYLRGLLYDEGFGVNKDFEMAFLLMRESAHLNHPAATYEVGRRFLYGIGVEKNEQNAFEWLMLAAGSPYYYPDAMYHLGLMYQEGQGMDADLAKAEEWFAKARSKGYKN